MPHLRRGGLPTQNSYGPPYTRTDFLLVRVLILECLLQARYEGPSAEILFCSVDGYVSNVIVCACGDVVLKLKGTQPFSGALLHC